MSEVTQPEQAQSTERDSRPKQWNGLWLVLASLGLLGWVGSLYVPAYVGLSPADLPPIHSPGRIIGMVLWPALVGLVVQRRRGRPKWKGILLGPLFGFLIYASAFWIADVNYERELPGLEGPWASGHELSPYSMRRLTRRQCVVKTVRFLESCDSDRCVGNMNSVLSTCLLNSRGDREAFCANFRTEHWAPNCDGGALSYRACQMLEVVEKSACL